MNEHEKAVVDAAVAWREKVDNTGDLALVVAVDALHRSSRLWRWRAVENKFNDRASSRGETMICEDRYAEIRDAFREMLAELEARDAD